MQSIDIACCLGLATVLSLHAPMLHINTDCQRPVVLFLILFAVKFGQDRDPDWMNRHVFRLTIDLLAA